APIGAVRLVAFSVVLTWTALAWGGLWGRSRDWIERSGRVLGGLWILSGLGDCASEFLEWFGPYFFRGGFR
ncbi:MAG TPA: hypothetical protein VFT74_21545, partial [Isosphaeraceae bacterium]|nr:hypothetical protein [Isosphaeraceae bacterium]